MSGAALAAAVRAALLEVEGLSNAFDGAPVRSGDGNALIEIGAESDWSHKSGEGREVRFSVSVRCGGERPDRARALGEAVRGALVGLDHDLDGWRLVSLAWLRSRMLREKGPRWAAVAEFRARMLRAS